MFVILIFQRGVCVVRDIVEPNDAKPNRSVSSPVFSVIILSYFCNAWIHCSSSGLSGLTRLVAVGCSFLASITFLAEMRGAAGR